ncbi:MAG: DUF924 family protein [Pseudomonadota bacterium]
MASANDAASPIDAVIKFWFGLETIPRWFRNDDQAAFDAECDQQAGDLMVAAMAGELDHWQRTPRGALALTILLDQLPRNLHRGTPEAFAADPKARAVATQAIEVGFDRDMMITARLFLYLPFEHSESLGDQERSVALHEQLGCPFYMIFAKKHHVIIERFGRFPHRNTILGRESTPEELAFLKEPDSSF